MAIGIGISIKCLGGLVVESAWLAFLSSRKVQGSTPDENPTSPYIQVPLYSGIGFSWLIEFPLRGRARPAAPLPLWLKSDRFSLVNQLIVSSAQL